LNRDSQISLKSQGFHQVSPEILLFSKKKVVDYAASKERTEIEFKDRMVFESQKSKIISSWS